MDLHPVAQEIIQNNIFHLRGQRVILDRDLATLYGVETRILNQAVRRNNCNWGRVIGDGPQLIHQLIHSE